MHSVRSETGQCIQWELKNRMDGWVSSEWMLDYRNDVCGASIDDSNKEEVKNI